MTVFVGPSIWRQWNVRAATATFAAITSNPTDEKVIFAPLWNDALIGRSRSLMCTEFLKTDADVMIIIDDDVVFEPPDFWKIVEGARETRSVYGGAYVTRSTTPHITSRFIPGSGELVFAQTPNRRPIEFQYLATGFWAVHRDVMEAMILGEFEDAYGTHRIDECSLGADRPFYPFFQPFVFREADGRLHYLSEDWAFSNRAKQLGFKVWVDLSIILIHMGDYPYTVRDLKNQDEGLPSTGIDLWETKGEPQITGDPLIDNLIPDIAEFMGESEGDTRRTLSTATDSLFKLWETRTDSEEDWYKREDVGLLYVHDLAAWHLRGGCPDASLNGTVLDYGCGIGTFALRNARAGAEVHIYEPNPVTREFALWRAEKYGIPLHVDECESYDAIVCWHVFEHVTEPEALLGHLSRQLKDDGLLVSQSGFEDTSTPMHHADPGWDAILARNGFAQVEPCLYTKLAAVPA
jgi:hypothetical protein